MTAATGVVEAAPQETGLLRRWFGGPWVKPILGVILVLVLVLSDEVYGCATGVGCRVSVWTIAGLIGLAAAAVWWRRLDEEQKRPAGLLGLAALVLLVVGQSAGPSIQVLPAVGSDKISSEINRDAAQVDVVVDMPFDPSQFHREQLEELGVFGGRDRSDLSDQSKLRFRAVSQENLEKMANLFWVEAILPFQ